MDFRQEKEKDKNSNYSGISGLKEIVKRLRSEAGCPWDRKQTAESLKHYVIEEAFEVTDAIDSGNNADIVEELGDLLLQVVFLSEIFDEKRKFSLDDVVSSINEKLLRRHPHVFDANFSIKEGECLEDIILKNWEKIKAEEKEEKRKKSGSLKPDEIKPSVFVPGNMPALHRAFMIQEKAKRCGFDFENIDDAMDKVNEEISELKEAMNDNTGKGAVGETTDKVKNEYGDILFSVVNIGRLLGIHPCEALNVSSEKFIKRFGYMEKESGGRISGISPAKLDKLWEDSKETC